MRRNGMHGRVHREGLDGTGDGNEAWHTAQRRKRACVRPATFGTGSCGSGRVWRTAKWDSTGYYSSPPSTSFSLHGLPSTSSSLHGLLFIQPPPRASPPAIVQPALHGVVLFIQPSTGSCSSTPTPARSIGVLFIQRQHHGGLFIQPPTGNCSSKPPSNAHCSCRGSIDRLQLTTVAKESLDRVQLTAIDRSLGISNA